MIDNKLLKTTDGILYIKYEKIDFLDEQNIKYYSRIFSAGLSFLVMKN